MSPTRTRTAMSGLGENCLLNPEHGPVIILDKGVGWCPDVAHTAAKPPTPALLTAQQALLDSAANPTPEEVAS